MRDYTVHKKKSAEENAFLTDEEEFFISLV